MSRDTFASMLAEAFAVNFKSPDIIFSCMPCHGLNNKGPSIINFAGFSYNFFKALIIESSVATLIPRLSISLAEDCPMP